MSRLRAKRSAWGSYANCWKSLGAGTTPGCGVGKAPGKRSARLCSGNWCACTRNTLPWGWTACTTCSSPSFTVPGEGLHRLMKAAGIHSQRKRAYKATTNSRHNCPIAPNCSNASSLSAAPTKPGWGDITLHPHRGRLAVFRHCQRPVHQKNRGLCLFPAHRHQLTPGCPEHGRPPGAPCPWTRSARLWASSTPPRPSVSVWIPWASGRACPARATPTTTLWRKTFSAA